MVRKVIKLGKKGLKKLFLKVGELSILTIFESLKLCFCSMCRAKFLGLPFMCGEKSANLLCYEWDQCRLCSANGINHADVATHMEQA